MRAHRPERTGLCGGPGRDAVQLIVLLSNCRALYKAGAGFVHPWRPPGRLWQPSHAAPRPGPPVLPHSGSEAGCSSGQAGWLERGVARRVVEADDHAIVGVRGIRAVAGPLARAHARTRGASVELCQAGGGILKPQS